MRNAIALVVASIASLSLAAEPWPLRPLTLDELRIKSESVFVIEDGTATVNGRLVKRIEFSESAGRTTTGEITLKNKTNQPLRPAIDVHVLNRYGMRIGHGSVHWAMDRVRPGEAASAENRVYCDSLKPVCAVLPYRMPPDIDVPAFVVIEDKSE